MELIDKVGEKISVDELLTVCVRCLFINDTVFYVIPGNFVTSLLISMYSLVPI